MLAADVLPIEALPQKNASEVKNKWAELVDKVREVGTVAVTRNRRVEMVVMDAATYQQMAALANAVEQRRQAALAELSASFDRRLAKLKEPDFNDKVDAIMEARGRSKRRPKAGASF